MTELFIYPLILAAVTGLAVLAFKSPEIYKIIFKFLLGLVVAVFIGVLLWGLAVNTTFHALYDYLQQDKIETARSVQKTINLQDTWILVCFILTGLYVGFLRLLSDLVEIHKRKQTKNSE